MTFEEVTRLLSRLRSDPNDRDKMGRMRNAVERLVPPDRLDPERVVLIAGTNGKGTTAKVLAELLQSAGERVGLFTSPHLECFTERFTVDGAPIPKTTFVETFEKVRSQIEGRFACFELLTLMALSFFLERSVDRLVLEVGMGGTTDATNAVPHSTAVITKIGLDHCRFLGHTLKEVGRHKLGVTTGTRRVVHLPFPEEVEKPPGDTTWIEAPSFQYRTEPGPRFLLHSRWGETEYLIPGHRGAENVNLALTTLEALGYDPSDFLGIVSEIRMPGRMERFDLPERPIYLSGDHNPQGVESLLELVPAYGYKQWAVLASLAPDKSLDEVLSPLLRLSGGRLFLTTTPSQQTTLQDYGEWTNTAAGAWSQPEEALHQIRRELPQGIPLLITGSLHLVGCLHPVVERLSVQ